MSAVCLLKIWYSSVYSTLRTMGYIIPSSPNNGPRKFVKSSITLPQIVKFCFTFGMWVHIRRKSPDPDSRIG